MAELEFGQPGILEPDDAVAGHPDFFRLHFCFLKICERAIEIAQILIRPSHISQSHLVLPAGLNRFGKSRGLLQRGYGLIEVPALQAPKADIDEIGGLQQRIAALTRDDETASELLDGLIGVAGVTLIEGFGPEDFS